ncbi:hypothetical protein ACFS2C_09495 [Prauserella oleivorans]|uniref:Uncharacterized protein n=1 Tax=Prauserella oleivorans TaxID=1478153 RepID=A0ABW5W944_9PSEU
MPGVAVAGDGARLVDVYAGLRDYLPTGRPTSACAGVSPADVRNWIRTHQHALGTCWFTCRDLPAA